jgi:maltose O-acetyltransferase
MAERSEKEKMLAGELYRALGPELKADARRATMLLDTYNRTAPDEKDRRVSVLAELLGKVGEETVIRPPFYCDYGYNIQIGRDTFVNFGCIFLDVASIVLGNNCQVGPSVQIYTADHPRDAQLRREGYESGVPIHIGNNVWLGGGSIILPGVSIGDDVIVGAGSVVTRDVPSGVTVVGNPARLLRSKT